jgi:hypothetical protein
MNTNKLDEGVFKIRNTVTQYLRKEEMYHAENPKEAVLHHQILQWTCVYVRFFVM